MITQAAQRIFSWIARLASWMTETVLILFTSLMFWFLNLWFVLSKEEAGFHLLIPADALLKLT